MKIAVIADPHFHDMTRRPDAGADAPAIRTYADSIASTRVFNESAAALRTLLDDIVRRGVPLVIVAGDLTDDGQSATMAATAALLDRYERRFGLRFLVTPGNHDLYAIHGRHQSKRFLQEDGSHVLVTSDENAPQGSSVARVVTADMYCGGYEAALAAMSRLGFFRRAADLHWESPFGASDALECREFIIRSADGSTTRRMIDASYLVEPVAGLWVLSIDANVFEPRDGDPDPRREESFHDSSNAGWNAMLRHKSFLFEWMKDVSERAERLGKNLLVFSHYPAIDPTNGPEADEFRFFGDVELTRRAPLKAVAEAVAATGIKVHFGGHLHVNHTAAFRGGDGFLINIAVPSMVGFPPAYKLVEFREQRLAVETVPISDVAGYDAAFPFYRREGQASGVDCRHLTDAMNHADFLDRHLGLLVRERYLTKEWLADLAPLVRRLSLADLGCLAGEAASLRPDEALARASQGGGPTFLDMVTDWYRLRKANGLAADFIAPDRIAHYEALRRRYRTAGPWAPDSVQARIATFLRLMGACLNGNPSLDFVIDLRSGAIEDLSAHRGRTERRQTGVA